ncbi:hypothetical protein ACOSQ2_027437 [Xanthoceras sorbifolium]
MVATTGPTPAGAANPIPAPVGAKVERAKNARATGAEAAEAGIAKEGDKSLLIITLFTIFPHLHDNYKLYVKLLLDKF